MRNFQQSLKVRIVSKDEGLAVGSTSSGKTVAAVGFKGVQPDAFLRIFVQCTNLILLCFYMKIFMPIWSYFEFIRG